MAVFMKKSPWKKEWDNLNKKEEKFTAKRTSGPTSELINKLDKVVPEKLSDTLNGAFYKGFELIFEKGTGVIEKTYNKERRETEYQVNEFAADMKMDRKAAGSFTKSAKASKTKNLLMSSIEGVGMGLVGAGIPDIPVFIGMLLKSVYEVALSYGYSYDTEEEKIFILKIIEAAMLNDDEFIKANEELNYLIDHSKLDGSIPELCQIEKAEQMKKTAETLSCEMLYTKFLQGQMIVGILGGVFDPIYVNRVSDYAVLKYRRRFIRSKARNAGVSLM